MKLKHLLSGLLALPALLAAGNDYDRDAAERKADWLFMEGLTAGIEGRDDARFALMSRALELTPFKDQREAYDVGSRRLMLGYSLKDSAMIAGGLALCDAYFAANPSDSYAGHFISTAYAGLGNLGRALEIYDTLEVHHPNSPSITANHAQLLLQAERFDDAIGVYRRLERSLGANTAVTQRISNIYLWKGDTVGALRVVEDYVAANPRNIEALQLGSSAATEFGETEKALDYILRAAALDPADGQNYLYAAQAYRKLGRNDDVERTFSAAMASDDLDRDNKVMIARAYIADNLAADSIEAHPRVKWMTDTLVALFPADYEVRMVAASFAIGTSDWAGAERHFEGALRADGSDPDDFITLARLYYTDKKPPEAIDAISRGLALHPSYSGLYEMKAGLLSLDGNYGGAAAAIRAALELDSLTDATRASLWRDLADLAQKDPKIGNPTELYEKALELNEDDDLVMNNYAYHLATHRGDLLRAKELIAKAVIYNPGSATYYDTYAWVLFRLGDLEGAKRYIDLALTSGSNTEEKTDAQIAELLCHAGAIYDALGQRAKARGYLERVLDLGDEADAETQAEARKLLENLDKE